MKYNMFSEICIFTRSCAKDAILLKNLYKSIEKFVPSEVEIVLVVEKEEYNDIIQYVPSFVSVYTEDKFATGTIQHKYTKLTADKYTERKYIFHIDSDSIFIKKIEYEDLFYEGKTILCVARWDFLESLHLTSDFIKEKKEFVIKNLLPTILMNELPATFSKSEKENWLKENLKNWCNSDYFNIWFEKWFDEWKSDYGNCFWRLGTERAIGHRVEYEYSRAPEKLYPREVYGLARGIIEKIHGVELKEFIKKCYGIQTKGIPKELHFSDLNFIGAVLHNYLPEKVFLVDVELNPDLRKIYINQFNSYVIFNDFENYNNEISKYLEC